MHICNGCVVTPQDTHITNAREPGTHFNSNMVRLRDLVCAEVWVDDDFQFLYGAIERLVSVLQRLIFFIFQFLYGAIERILFLLMTFQSF